MCTTPLVHAFAAPISPSPDARKASVTTVTMEVDTDTTPAPNVAHDAATATATAFDDDTTETRIAWSFVRIKFTMCFTGMLRTIAAATGCT